jgi:hypothetical protein
MRGVDLAQNRISGTVLSDRLRATGIQDILAIVVGKERQTRKKLKLL